MKNFIPNPSQKVVITFDKQTTLARIYEDNKVVAKGIATCSPEDQFDIKAGSELALTRALESLAPKVDPKNTDWVVVHRKPRVGDYIRLIRDCYKFTEKGDILRVSDVSYGEYSTLVKVKGGDHPRQVKACKTFGPEYRWNYLDYEFEVVERAPKKPVFRKITRLPKKGDYMRVIKSSYSFDTPDRYLKLHEVRVNDAGNLTGVSVHSDEHPGALSKGLRCYINWNYCMWPKMCDVEFYEKVDDTIVVYNGKRFRKVDRDLMKGDYIKLAKPFFTFDTTEDFMKVNHVSKHRGKTVPHVRHADNPGAVRHYSGVYEDCHIWNYWDFTGNVYECLDD